MIHTLGNNVGNDGKYALTVAAADGRRRKGLKHLRVS